ncbi:MAG: bacillithiol biosynthesis cysteine-adding enzyme BshC [Acidobacteriota bacterium]
MTVSASSSSATKRLFELPLEDRLPPLPTAYLAGRDLDLLEPLKFLAPGELPTSAAEPAQDRAPLAAALAVANEAYGHPRAQELADRLADPATRVVVTGQQPGLFGGPLLALTKTLAAVRQVRAFEARGESAVAVFWMATEDHDFAEVAQTTFLGRGQLQHFDLGEDPAPLLPVGMRTLGSGFDAVAAEVESLVGGEEATARLDRLRAWYRADARFGEAFARMLVGILGADAPLILDSMLSEAKRLQAPFLRRLVEARAELDDGFARADRRIQERGHPLQVNPQPGLSPLFLLHGQERRRIEWQGDDRFGLRGVDGYSAPVAELLERLDDNPAVVSPGVLARPAIQDAILGSTLQVMGPSELSYLAQAAPSYRILGIDAPWTSLRPQALVLDGRQAGYLEELGISLAELLEQPLEKLLASRLGDDFVTPARERIGQLVAELRDGAVGLDPSLEKPWRKTRDLVDRALDQLASKVAAATARRHGVWLRRFEQLRDAILPDGHLQERELSTAFFYCRYGDDLVRSMLEQLDPDPRRMNVVRLE